MTPLTPDELQAKREAIIHEAKVAFGHTGDDIVGCLVRRILSIRWHSEERVAALNTNTKQAQKIAALTQERDRLAHEREKQRVIIEALEAQIAGMSSNPPHTGQQPRASISPNHSWEPDT